MARGVDWRRRLVRHFSWLVRPRPFRLVCANLLVLTSLAATVGIAAHPAAAARAPAATTAPSAQAATGCTPFTDNFGQDTALSPNWQTNTPFLASIAAGVAAPYTPPRLQFSTSGMDMQGAGARNLFTGIQSVTSCEAPFSFETNVEGLTSNGNTFVVYLVSADASEGFSIEGNLNPKNTPFYGVFARNALGASNHHGQDIDPDPAVNSVYDVKMSVDANGSGVVTLSGAGVPNGVTVPVGSVGSGPFYVVLGQREGGPKTVGTNDALWSNAVLSAGTPVTASLADELADRCRRRDRARGRHSGGERIGLDRDGIWRHRVGAAQLHPAQLHRSGIVAAQLDPSQLDPTQLDRLSPAQEPRRAVLPPPNRRSKTRCYPTCPSTTRTAVGRRRRLHFWVEGRPRRHQLRERTPPNRHARRCVGEPDLRRKSRIGQPRRARSLVQPPQLHPPELDRAWCHSPQLDRPRRSQRRRQLYCGVVFRADDRRRSSCADFGINPSDSSTTATLLSLALAGVPSAPYRSAPFP